ncbi:response regulator transcription factor [Escherichia coli]|uniref:response regulator transcription factor n=1 Tax=Escherichia coli TaxID=562 RepID=UPI0038B2E7DA
MMVIIIFHNKRSCQCLYSELERFGYEVDLFIRPDEGELSFHTVSYCIVILATCFKNNVSTLIKFRNGVVQTAVIILNKSTKVTQKIIALNSGVDDCVDYPFDIEELLARLCAIVRRSYGAASSYLCHGEIQFDSIAREIYLQKRLVNLTSREMALLEIFY